MSLLQTPWTSQPQQAVGIDPRFNLGVWLPPAARRNLLSGVACTPINSGPGTFSGSGGLGFGASGQTLTATTGKALDTGLAANPSKLTFITVFESYDAPSSAAAYGSPAHRDQYAINWHHDSASYRGSFSLHTGATYPVVLLGDKSANKLHVVVATWDGSLLKVWQNGKYQGSAAASGSLNTTNASALRICANVNGYSFNGNVYLVGVSSSAIPDGEALSLSANPWQIFKPLPRRIFVPVAAATGDGTGTGSLYSLTLSSPSATASGTANASASGSVSTIALTAPSGSASAGTSATASGSLSAVTTSAPSAAATGTALATGSLSSVTLSTVSGTATGTTAGSAVGTGAIDSIQIDAPTAIAIASSVATGGFQSIGLTAPNGTASAVDSQSGTAIAALQYIYLVAPTGTASDGTYANAPSGAGPTVISSRQSRPSKSSMSRPSVKSGGRF